MQLPVAVGNWLQRRTLGSLCFVMFVLAAVPAFALDKVDLQLLGYESDEVIGRSVDFPFELTRREEMLSRLHQVVQEGIDDPDATYRGRWHYRHRDGRHIEVEGTSRRLEYANHRAGQHLLSLINDVLEISRIEAGRTLLQSAPFDLNEILSSVEEMIRVKADDQGLKFITAHAADLPAFVEGDGPHLKQVLINLLGNAVKYTEQGQLALQVSRRNGEINFEVSDTGPGISEQDHARIFQPFYQTQSGIAKGEGTGLGLAISQEYTKMMKGRLEVKSQIGQGSTFTLSLPLPETAAPAAQAATRSVIGLESGQEEIRVLIVDDKEDNRELVMQLLAPTGFALRTANDGQQAIDSFVEWQPQLIWMDMRMPVLDGYQATQQIRALPGGDQVKIVALTASAFEEERAKIIESGCDDMVRKPLEEASLFTVMGDLLNLRYRYAEVVETSVTPPEKNLDFSKLSPNQIATLKAAAEALDLARIRQEVAALKETHPALAATLDDLLQEFRFDRIVELCRA